MNSEVDDLPGRITGWKELAFLDAFSHDAVEWFNGVGRIDRFSNVVWIVEDRVQIFPVYVP